MAANHSFMSLSISSLLVIVPGYWSLIHKEAMERAGDNTFEKFYQIINHILPALACLYNFFATDFLFYRGFSKVTLSIAFLYCGMSFTKAKLTGQYEYWFLTWNDYLSIVVAIASCLAAITLPYILANVTEFVKNRKLPNHQNDENKKLTSSNRNDNY